ncbi:MAG: hypothetical protein HUU57_09730 [Bdellovibrio sp.]|nr:hypothetical protein [Bdellovibrio sp.]
MERLIKFVAILLGVLVLNGCGHSQSGKAASSSSAVKEAPKELLLPKYEKLLKDHPAKSNPLPWCKVPKVKLHKKSNIYRKAIKNEFEEGGKRPNFCGSYFLLATPSTGGGEIFIFDCRTGNPNVFTSGKTDTNPLVSAKSCVFVVNPPLEDSAVSDFTTKAGGEHAVPANGRPIIHRFDGKKISPVEDTIWPK